MKRVLLFMAFFLSFIVPLSISAQESTGWMLIDDFERGIPLIRDTDGNDIGFVPFGDTRGKVWLAASQTFPYSEIALPDQANVNTVLTLSHRIQQWGGFARTFNDGSGWITQDWSGYDALRFWLYGARTGGTIQVEIFDNRASSSTSDTAERYFVKISDNFSGWQSFTLAFSDFQRREDFQPSGAPNDGLGLTEVHGYAFSFPATGRPLTNHLDNVAVVTNAFVEQEAAEIAQAAAEEAAAMAAQGDWQLIWEDNFDGEAGAKPDADKWDYNVGGSGWGNNEHQFYTARPENVALSGDGSLVITAKEGAPDGASCWYGACMYSSSRLVTQNKFAFTYGRVEGRIKVPFGQGIWPAFWMLGTDINTVGWPKSGEIDIMENIGREPKILHGTIHGPGYSGGNGVSGAINLPQNLADDFHVFAIEWETEEIRWYLDDTEYFKVTTADLRGNEWVYDHDFFILLNVAVGGNWPGYPDDTTTFPQQMLIDYVRVYQRSTE